MQCVILVGGQGTRLGSLTRTCPKPMLPVGGRPFVERLIENAARFGATRILLLAGHLGEVVKAHFPNGVFRSNGRTVSVDVLVEPEPLGTGGALRFAQDRLDDWFLVLNGDTLFSFNWLDIITTPLPSSSIGCIALRRIENAERYGVVWTDSTDRVIRMLERPGGHGPGLINCGVYWLNRQILDYIPSDTLVSLERETFVRIVSDNALYAREYTGSFIDIGVPRDYRKAQELDHKPRGAIFFDRDGVLNRDDGYTYRVEDFKWIDGAVEAIRAANDADFYVFVVTNQAGVAHDYYTEADVRRLHVHIQEDLRQAGAHIDDFRFCPHHPAAENLAYRTDCPWRKPRPGMLLDLLANWPLDISRSLLIGDKKSDTDAAKAIGLRFFRFEVKNRCRIDSIDALKSLIYGAA